MICPNCGNTVEDGNVFCMHCGAKLFRPTPNPNSSTEGRVLRSPSHSTSTHETYRPEPSAPPVQPVQPIVIQQREITEDQLPARFRPLGAWAYFGYGLLFAIPIVGFIFLIVFSCSSANINRRNYARSYWCVLVLAAIIFGVVLLIAAATGGIASLFDW
jgi:hypothetical protein